MTKLRAVIIDDEPLARLNISDALGAFPEISVVGEFSNGDIPSETLAILMPDILFLDIEMPTVNGIELASRILATHQHTAIIFVTAYDKYAVQAFDLHAIDYLLKPFDSPRFAQAVERAKTNLSLISPYLAAEQLKQLTHSPYITRLIIKTTGSVRVIAVDDIRWLRSSGNYVEVHHREGMHLHRTTLAFIEKHIDNSIFCKVHRTAIVRLGEIKEIKVSDHNKYSIVLHSGDNVPLSKVYREKLMLKLTGISMV
ncbi:response regulator transcription factor [Exilibacterium tricleocarpae]|uniref:Response regulator transcription factor n=1 Tax=Exilibacterium tricleocarpae TaxID=2591008 RepID=A0A545UBF0_9GAMM|nr:LytTR family DNA-binding domain-containing protein [Exilibacterium tricleocarpae]TQV86796.1 response regulator transcription factor [Exilibacterium tricleocarpae]